MTYKRRALKGVLWSVSIWGLSNIYIEIALAQPGRYDNRHMGRWMMDHWGMGGFGMIFMVLLWALIIAAFVLLIRWLFRLVDRKAGSNAGESSKATGILNERYARGEINRDEFETMKKDILK